MHVRHLRNVGVDGAGRDDGNPGLYVQQLPHARADRGAMNVECLPQFLHGFQQSVNFVARYDTGNPDDCIVLEFNRFIDSLRQAAADGAQMLDRFAAACTDADQRITRILQGYPGTKHKHAQPAQRCFKQFVGQYQVIGLIALEDAKIAQHSALGRTQCAQLAVRLINLVNVVGELGLKKFRCVLAVGSDNAEVGKVAEKVSRMCNATLPLRIAERGYTVLVELGARILQEFFPLKFHGFSRIVAGTLS